MKANAWNWPFTRCKQDTTQQHGQSALLLSAMLNVCTNSNC